MKKTIVRAEAAHNPLGIFNKCIAHTLAARTLRAVPVHPGIVEIGSNGEGIELFDRRVWKHAVAKFLLAVITFKNKTKGVFSCLYGVAHGVALHLNSAIDLGALPFVVKDEFDGSGALPGWASVLRFGVNSG